MHGFETSPEIVHILRDSKASSSEHPRKVIIGIGADFSKSRAAY